MSKVKHIDSYKNERYDLIKKEYKKRGFDNLGEAMNDHDFFYWVQRLKKSNKNFIRK